MLPRFCPDCGSPVPRPERGPGGTTRLTRRTCPECHARISPRPNVDVAALLTRRGPSGVEVLLVRRRSDAPLGGGLYTFPGRSLRWNEDAREGAILSMWEQAGLKVTVREAYDVHSDFHHPEEQRVVTWFRVEPEAPADGNGDGPPPPLEPRAGADADQAAFFALDDLPELAFPNDALVLGRLAKEDQGGEVSAAALEADLSAQLSRRRQKYRDLLQAYTDELMRGAWINEMHLRLSEVSSPAEVAAITATHISGRREVDKVQVWYPGPPDRCDTCPWVDRCPREACLHLVAHITESEQESEVQPLALALARDESSTDGDDNVAMAPAREQRVPLLRGVPAGDVVLTQAPVRAELPGAGVQPIRFNGFPLAMRDELPGVLGLTSRVPIDANARRLFEVVARHVGALVANARLVEDLRAANNVKRSFIARLSHELKTPITAILGFAELLREELEAEGNALGADGAATIESSGRKLLDIVETILEIAKLESTAAAFEPVRMDLGQVIEERLGPFRERAKEKGVELSLLLPEGEPVRPKNKALGPGADARLVVWADPRRVAQVIDQLVDNALKFTDDGSVTVTLEPGPEAVTCHVQDSGIGVAPENQRRIFDAFSQVSESIHLEYGGLGLGLAIAKVVVDKLGGRIWVDSHLGQGSTFSFSLPRSASVATLGAAASPA